MNDRRPEPTSKSIENQRKLVKTFAVLFGFIVAPAVAVGYAFLLGWTDWALLATLVSCTMIQAWAYRKRTLVGRSQRMLVLMTATIIIFIVVSATIQFVAGTLWLVLVGSYVVVSKNTSTTLTLEELTGVSNAMDLPVLKLSWTVRKWSKFAHKIEEQGPLSQDRLHWVSIFNTPRDKNETGVFFGISIFLAVIISAIAYLTTAWILIAIIPCALLIFVYMRLSDWLFTFVINTPVSIWVVNSNKWGKDNEYERNKLNSLESNTSFIGNILGYSAWSFNMPGDTEVSKQNRDALLRYVPMPSLSDLTMAMEKYDKKDDE